MDINKLIKEAHQNAIDRGFYECQECEGAGNIILCHNKIHYLDDFDNHTRP